MKNIKNIIKLIKTTGSDILVIKAKQDDVENLADQLDRLEIKILLIGVDDLEAIQHLNETEMAKFGWFRLEKIEKIQGPNKPERGGIRIHRHRPYDERYGDMDNNDES